MTIGIRAEIISNSAGFVCCRIPALEDKSTMNLFAIDSPRELREDKLGLN
jgi:hypothetical protein